jgi:hypothetical protein
LKNLSGQSVLVVLLLVASIATAAIAFYSPKPSPPSSGEGLCMATLSQNGDPVISGRASAACGAAVSFYGVALGSYHSSIWTLPEVSDSLFFVALLCFAIPRMKAPESLRKRIALSRPLMPALVLVGVVGLGIFGYAETFNILYANSARGYSAGNPTYWSFFSIDPQLADHAVLGLIAASACFCILRAEKGLSKGVRSGVTFGAFWVAVAQLCLLVFDYKEMYLYVTSFSSSWTLFGFPILSNWFVLAVALSLAAWGVVPSKRAQGDHGWAAPRVHLVG